MPIRVAAAVVNQTPLDWAGNVRNIVASLEAARAAGASAVCLPELCLTGYGCEDAFHGLGLQARVLEALEEILPSTGGLVVCLGMPLLHSHALFSVACVAVDGRIAGFVAKQHLCGDGLHYEPRWFKPWPKGVRDTVRLGGRDYPIGDLVFDCGGIKLGFEICEDAWVAGRTGGGLAPQAVDLIFNPSASHFAFGKAEIRKRLVTEGSRAFRVGYVYANLLGNEAGRIVYDGGALVASMGSLLAAGPRLSFRPWHVTTADVDVEANRMAVARLASFEPSLGDADPLEVACPFEWPAVQTRADAERQAAWETGPHVKEEEFARAVALGLFDYLRKSRSAGFVVSLSGGADSSAVACLVALMAEMAHTELGDTGFAAALGHVGGLEQATGHAERVGRLLHCVYQATQNSGPQTRHSAITLAAALGARMACLEIQPLVDGYIAAIEGVLERRLEWQTDDVALQNVQARVRGPSVWLLANVQNALLLSTSNRSEAAVGYATMDGDTCGGLSPIAGIDKAFLLDWLRWLETTGPAGVHPIPALAVVNQMQPTAELRPPSARQTDEDDLMPYRVLDAIERLAIRDKRPPVDVFAAVGPRFPQYPPQQMGRWVERFFRLWCRNQWKRERYAPSFHLDDENLDPKTWCRFPILSGGFERELEELRQRIAETAVS